MPEFHPGILNLMQNTILVITICALLLLIVSFLIAAVIKAADDV